MKTNQPQRRRDITTAPKTTRSRLTNGSDLLPGADQRTAPFRRYRDLVSIIAADLGGVDLLSEARKQLVRRFAATSVMAEQLEAQLVEGANIDIEQHAKLSSSLVKLGSRIGLGRHARTVPDLQDYLRAKAAEQQADVIDREPEPAS